MMSFSESDEELQTLGIKWKGCQRSKVLIPPKSSSSHPQSKRYRCCVPNCPTIDTIDNFVKFPSAYTHLQKWLDAIPQFEDVITSSTMVCRHHFLLHQLKTDYCDGTLRTTMQVPTIFGRVHEAVNWYPRYMFELHERDVKPQNWDCLENDDKDFIRNIGAIWDYYVKNMERSFRQWKVISTDKFIIFYILQIDTVMKIKCSVKINTELKVEVTLNGRCMDPADLTWILPITCQITRWTQLNELLGVLDGSTKS